MWNNGVAAWVDIVSDDVCFKEKKVAAFPAFSEDVSVFVNYPQAIEALHKEAAQFVKGMTGGAVRLMAESLRVGWLLDGCWMIDRCSMLDQCSMLVQCLFNACLMRV